MSDQSTIAKLQVVIEAAWDKALATFRSGKSGLKEVEEQAQRTEGAAGRLSTKMVALGTTIGNLAAGAIKRMLSGVVQLSREMVTLGMRVGESTSKFDTVFGNASKSVRGFIGEFAHMAGMSKNTAQEMLATTGSIAQGMGMAQEKSAEFSTEVVKLAGDLGSFNNLDTADVLAKINSALTGEREGMKALGIVISETEVQKRALNMTGKKSVDLLTQEEKAMASLAIITDKAGVAVGDLERTKDSAANRAKKLTAQFETLKETLAEALQPAFEVFLDLVSFSDQEVESFDNRLKNSTQTLAEVARWTVIVGRTVWEQIRLISALTKNLVEAAIHAVRSAVAGGIAGVSGMILKAIETVNSFIAFVNKIPGVNLSGFDGAEEAVRGIYNAAIADSRSATASLTAQFRDMGDAFKHWTNSAREVNQLMRDVKKPVAVSEGGSGGGSRPGSTPDAPGGKDKKGKPKKEGKSDAEKAAEAAARRIEELLERAADGVAKLEEMNAAAATLATAGFKELENVPESIRTAVAQVGRLTGQIADIDRLIADLGNTNPELRAKAEALRAEWAKNKDAAQAQVQSFADANRWIQALGVSIPTVGVKVGEAMVVASDAFGTLADRLTELEGARQAVKLATLAGDREGVRRSTAAATAAEKAFREELKRVAQVLQASGLPAEKIAEILKAIEDRASGAGVELDKAAKSFQEWEKAATLMADIAAGVAAVGDAIGILDGKTKAALQSVAQLGQGAARLFASGGTDVGAWVQVISGSITLLKGLFTNDAGRENRLAMASLTRALQKLEAAVLKNVSGNSLQQDREAMAKAAGILRGDRRTFEGGSIGDKADRNAALASLAVQLGLAQAGDKKDTKVDALKAWAQELDQTYKTNLAKFVENSDSAGLMRALEELYATLGVKAGELGQFGNDVEGVLARVRYELELLGETDAAARIRAVTSALKAAGKDFGEFADELEELMTLDLDSEEGRARRDAILAEMNARLLASDPTKRLGDLTPEQWRELMLEWSRASGGKGTAGGSSSVSQVTGISSIQANQWLAHASTQTDLQRQIRDILARMGGITLPHVPTTAGSAGGVHVGDVNVTIEAANLAPENARAVGQQIGAGILDRVRQEARQEARGRGIPRGTRITIETEV